MIRTTAAMIVAVVAVTAAQTLADESCGPFRLISPAAVPATHFGASTATNGRFWFVGDPQARTLCAGSPLGCSTGAVHVYERIDGIPIFTQTLVPEGVQGWDQFGSWLDADGDRLVVGSLYTDWPTTEARGGGFIYEFDGEQWVAAGQLVPPAEVTSDLAGSSVALQGDMAILSPYRTLAKYVYAPGPTGWAVTSELVSPDGLSRELGFGSLVDIEQEWIFTSAWKDGTLVREGGSVYVFARTSDGRIEFTQKIFPPNPETNVRFGSFVVSDGQTLAVSAIRAERDVEYQGAIFIYEFDGEEWKLR